MSAWGASSSNPLAAHFGGRRRHVGPLKTPPLPARKSNYIKLEMKGFNAGRRVATAVCFFANMTNSPSSLVTSHISKQKLTADGVFPLDPLTQLLHTRVKMKVSPWPSGSGVCKARNAVRRLLTRPRAKERLGLHHTGSSVRSVGSEARSGITNRGVQQQSRPFPLLQQAGSGVTEIHDPDTPYTRYMSSTSAFGLQRCHRLFLCGRRHESDRRGCGDGGIGCGTPVSASPDGHLNLIAPPPADRPSGTIYDASFASRYARYCTMLRTALSC